jgi:hypothetical protein
MTQSIVPSQPIIGEKKSYASPMSYVGSYRRIAAWARKFGQGSPAKAVTAWVIAGIGIFLMWFVILAAWYFITLVVFGIFMIPFRLMRRSQRKQTHLQEQQLATMQAMMVQQQAALAAGDKN